MRKYAILIAGFTTILVGFIISSLSFVNMLEYPHTAGEALMGVSLGGVLAIAGGVAVQVSVIAMGIALANKDSVTVNNISFEGKRLHGLIDSPTQ